MSLVFLVLLEWKPSLFLDQTVISLVRNDETVPVSEEELIEAKCKELSEAISLPRVYEFCHHHNIIKRIGTGIDDK